MSLQEIILPNGDRKKLGNIVPPESHVENCKVQLPVFGDTPSARVIPRSDWDKLVPDGDLTDDQFLPYVHDQNGIGQCNCDATAAAAEYTRSRQGLPFVKLSAADLYDRINGGQDNGSMLEDAMAAMLSEGIGTAETCGTLWRRGMKTASASERGQYKVLEAFVCPTFDHVFSAALQGFALVSGIFWYDGYYVDDSGWLVPRQSGNRGGHAVFGHTPRRKGQKYGVDHTNSWTPQWGRKGRAVFPEDVYQQRGIGGWWCIRSIVDRGGVVPMPK